MGKKCSKGRFHLSEIGGSGKTDEESENGDLKGKLQKMKIFILLSLRSLMSLRLRARFKWGAFIGILKNS